MRSATAPLDDASTSKRLTAGGPAGYIVCYAVAPTSPHQRRLALEELFSLDAPAADWDILAAEIEAGYHS
ncbi:MAG: hypothetical protein ACR2K2_08015 [Mycobacteriales bacterium]